MKKILSIATVFCFFVNSISFALSPPLISGDLGENTYQNKFLTLANIGLAKDLAELNKLKSIVNARDKETVQKAFQLNKRLKKDRSYRENTVFKPADITSYFNMVEHVGGNIFRIPVSVEKNEVRGDYQLLFSTVIDGDNGFPIYFCTDEQFEKLEASIKTHKQLPYREKEEEEFISKVRSRYEEQDEKNIDKFIDDRIQEGNFAEIKGRREELGWSEERFPGLKQPAPDNYWSPDLMNYIKASLNPFLGHLDIDVDKALKGKNIIFIKAPKGVEFPIIEEDGHPVQVASHTSENAVYFFLSESYFDKFGGQQDKEELDFLCTYLLTYLVHEIGVIYGLPWKLVKLNKDDLWDISNSLDLLHLDYLLTTAKKAGEGSKETSDKAAVFSDHSQRDYVKYLISQGPVNLDYLFWKDPTTVGDEKIEEKYIMRDYADTSKDRLQSIHTKQLATAIAYAYYVEHIAEFDKDQKSLDIMVRNLTQGKHEETALRLEEVDLRFRLYLDIVLEEYVLSKKIIKAEELAERKDIFISRYKDLYTKDFSQTLDSALREKAIFIIKKVTEEPVLYKEVNKNISDFFEEFIGKIQEISPEKITADGVRTTVGDEIRDLAIKILEAFYGRQDFITSEAFQVILSDSFVEINDRENNPYWKTVEEDLSSAIEKDEVLVIERCSPPAVASFDQTPDAPQLQLTNFNTKSTVDWDLIKYVSEKDSRKYDLSKHISQAYELLDLWTDVYGTIHPDNTFWQTYFENNSDIEMYREILQKVFAVNELFDADAGKVFLKNCFGKGQEEYDHKKTVKLLNKEPERMQSFKEILHFCVLPKVLQKWIKMKYEQFSGKDWTTMFTESDTIAVHLLAYVKEQLEKAREAKIFMRKGEFFVSGSAREVTHVRRGLLQEDTGMWIGEMFLKEFLQAAETEEKAAEDFALLRFNEAMHMGNPIVRHGEVSSLAGLNHYIEHIKIESFEKARKNWINYIEKPWEPMFGTYPDAQSEGSTVAQDESMQESINRVKHFIEDKDQHILLIEAERGEGKSNLVEAMKAMMNLDSRAYKKVDCGVLAGLSPDYVRHLFFGELEGILFKKGTAILKDLAEQHNSLLVFDHVEKANEFIQNLLIEILDYSREVTMVDGDTLSLKNIKIVLLKDLDASDRFSEGIKFDKKLNYRVEETVWIPELYQRKGDILRLAEKFNHDYSKSKGIPWAPLEENTAKIIKWWFEHKEIRRNSVNDLKKLMERIVEARRILLERMREYGTMGMEDIYKRPLISSPFLPPKKDKIADDLPLMLSPHLITLIDILYSGVDMPSLSELNENIRETLKTLHRAFNNKQGKISPYFLLSKEKTTKDSLYYGLLDWEQPGMTDSHPRESKNAELTREQVLTRKEIARKIAQRLLESFSDLLSTQEHVDSFANQLTQHMAFKQVTAEQKIIIEANLRFNTYVDQALAAAYYYEDREIYKDNFSYDWPLGATTEGWSEGEYCTGTFPAQLDTLLRDTAVEFVKKENKLSTSNIMAELKESTLNTTDLPTDCNDNYNKFPRIFQMVADWDNAKKIHPLRNQLIAKYFGSQDLIKSPDFLEAIALHLKDIYEKEANPYWQAIEEDVGDFVEADRAFEIDPKTGVVTAVKTGKDTISGEKFSDAVKQAYEKLNFWADMDTHLNLSSAQGFHNALNQKILRVIKRALNIEQISLSKKDDYTEEQINAIFFQTISPEQLKRAKQIIRFHYLPNSVQKWISEIKEELSRENAMFSVKDDITPRLLDYVTECADKARKSMPTIAQGTFYVSPRTNTLIHDGRGISRDTSRVWMGEYFLQELAPGKDYGITVEEFALVFLNAAMHMENVNVCHDKIEHIKDVGTVVDHVHMSDKYDKAARAWWKYVKNPRPWAWSTTEVSTLLRARISTWDNNVIDRGFIKGKVRSVLIQGKPGSGLSRLAEDICAEMQLKNGMDSKQVRILSCKKLLNSAYSPDSLRAEFFGKYANDDWNPGILEQIGYKKRHYYGMGGYQLHPASLLVIDDFHVIGEALKGTRLRAKALALLTIFEEILADEKKILFNDPTKSVTDIDIKTLKILFVSNKELSGEISGVLNIDKKLTASELWEWNDDDIAGLAEEFSREESEKSGLFWAPLEETTARFIINRVRENKFQIKDLQEFMKAVVLERAKWMREWEKTRTIPDFCEYVGERVDITPYHKYFSPYFTSLFFVSSKAIRNKRDVESFWFEFLKMTNLRELITPYFKEFAPRNAEGKVVHHYGGPFLSKYDGRIFEQPGMTESRRPPRDLKEEKYFQNRNLEDLAWKTAARFASMAKDAEEIGTMIKGLKKRHPKSKAVQMLPRISARYNRYIYATIAYVLASKGRMPEEEELKSAIPPPDEAFPQEVDDIIRKRAMVDVRQIKDDRRSQIYDEIKQDGMDVTRHEGFNLSSYLEDFSELIKLLAKKDITGLKYGLQDCEKLFVSKTFVDALIKYLGKIEEEKENPYWQTVEEDIRDFVNVRGAVKTGNDNKIKDFKTGESIEESISFKDRELINRAYGELAFWAADFNKGFLKEQWKGNPQIFKLVFKRFIKSKDVQKLLQKYGLFGGISGIKESDFNAVLESNAFTLIQLQPIIYFYALPEKLQEWIKERYHAITGKDASTMFYDSSKDSYWSDKTLLNLMNYVRDTSKKAYEAQIFMIKDAFYVSPRTKETTHVRRGLKQEDTGRWMAELFVRGYYDLWKEGEESAVLEDFALLFFNGAMHIGRDYVQHGRIESLEDLNEVIEHTRLTFYDEVCRRWESSSKKPWEPLLPGKNVGKDASMVSLFAGLERFVESRTQNTILIEGRTGTGKNMAAEAIKAMMKLGEDAVRIIDCKALAGLSTEELRKELYGEYHDGEYAGGGIIRTLAYKDTLRRTYRDPALLIIDRLESADENMQAQLLQVLDDSRKIYMSDKTLLDLSHFKIVCLADREVKKPDKDYRLKTRVEGNIVEIPNLFRRGDDMVLLAEYFNYIESRANNIPWAPLDESTGQLIKDTFKMGLADDSYREVRDLKNLISKVVEARSVLLKNIETQGELGENDLEGESVYNKVRAYGKDQQDEFKTIFEGIFSRSVITLVDVIYSMADSLSILRSKYLSCIEDYTSKKVLYPYFKEELAPRNANGEIVGFYKGPFTFHQPGMTKEKSGSRLTHRESDVVEQNRKSLAGAIARALNKETIPRMYETIDELMEKVKTKDDKIEEILRESESRFRIYINVIVAHFLKKGGDISRAEDITLEVSDIQVPKLLVQYKWWNLRITEDFPEELDVELLRKAKEVIVLLMQTPDSEEGGSLKRDRNSLHTESPWQDVLARHLVLIEERSADIKKELYGMVQYILSEEFRQDLLQFLGIIKEMADYPQAFEGEALLRVKEIIRKIKEKVDQLSILVGRKTVTRLEEKTVAEIRKILDSHWVSDEDFDAMAEKAGEAGKAFCRQVAREARMPFEMIIALRKSAEEKDSQPLVDWVHKILERVENEELAPDVVRKTITRIAGRLSSEKCPTANGIVLEKLLKQVLRAEDLRFKDEGKTRASSVCEKILRDIARTDNQIREVVKKIAVEYNLAKIPLLSLTDELIHLKNSIDPKDFKKALQKAKDDLLGFIAERLRHAKIDEQNAKKSWNGAQEWDSSPWKVTGVPTNVYQEELLNKWNAAIQHTKSLQSLRDQLFARNAENSLQPGDETPLSKAVKQALAMLPANYREKNGTDHEHVARAINEVPYLKSSDMETVMNYLEEFFAKYLFRGKKCEVKVKKIDKVPKEMKKKRTDANLMEQAFRNPPGDFDAAMFIDVIKLERSIAVFPFFSHIESKVYQIPDEEVRDTYGLPEKTTAVKYHIAIALTKHEASDNVTSIHMEMRSNKTVDAEGEVNISAKKHTNRMDEGELREALLSSLTGEEKQVPLPKDIEGIISKNVINLSRMDEKSALIFSEKVTFDNGLGVLLPKLVKAGLKVAVIAKDEKQRQAIEVLNKTELAGQKEKIVLLEYAGEATQKLSGVTRFYYFKVEADSDESVPESFNVIDITNMVKQILKALGKASGIIKEEEIRMLHAAAEQFAASV